MLEMTTVAGRGPAKGPSAPESPVHARYPCALPTSCQPPSSLGNEEIRWEGRLHDISAGGVGIVLCRRFEPGAVLSIDLADRDGNPFTLLGKVTNVRHLPEGNWLLGCNFVSQLSLEEVESLCNLSAERAAQAEAGSLYRTPLVPPSWVSAGSRAS